MNMNMTTAPVLTTQQRDASMVERHADGETLESIGQSFGLTRERVRQIIKKIGGTNAEESRQKRMADKESAVGANRDGFLAEFGEISRQIAKTGTPRQQAISKLKALFPEIDEELAEDALRGSKILFDKNSADEIFSKEAVAAAVWYLLGSDLGLNPDHSWSAVNLDLSLIEELQRTLGAAQATSEDIATILGVIGASKKHLLTNPDASITASRYGQLRDELVAALGFVSRQGATPWPPTRQTVTKRFGGWNEALEAMGLGTAIKGRPKGLVKFSEQDYDDSVRLFWLECSRSGTNATFDAYEKWASNEVSTGFDAPSGASIRNFYGTWTEAIRSVQD